MSALTDFFFELAEQALNAVDPTPPVPLSPACASGEAQPEPVGSPTIYPEVK